LNIVTNGDFNMTRLIQLSVLVCVFVACKPKAVSTLKSLDNYAAGARVRTNDCAGDPKLSSDRVGQQIASDLESKHMKFELSSGADKTALSTAVKNAFSALPMDVQGMFLALQGQIVVTKDANQYCTVMDRLSVGQSANSKQAEITALKEGKETVSACYWFMPPDVFEKVYKVRQSKRAGQIFTVFVKDDVQEIRHGLVRAFGYMVAQVSPRIMTNDKTFTQADLKVSFVENENPSFRDLKRRVAEAFLIDIKNRPTAAKFAKFGVTGNADADARAAFQDHVYAEAFDSMYCNAFASGNANTRKRMETEFPHTFLAFSLPPASSGKGSQKNNFSLAGEESAKGFGLWWNPLTSAYNGAVATGNWVGRQAQGIGTAVSETVQGAGVLYNEYAERRDKHIERQTQDFMNNYGRPPSLLESASIGAYAVAKTGGRDVPLAGDLLGAATDFAEAGVGAASNAQGQARLLTVDERLARARDGAITTAVETVPWGDLAAGGGKVLMRGANSAFDGGTNMLIDGLMSTGRAADLDTAGAMVVAGVAKDRVISNATKFVADQTSTLRAINRATGGAAGELIETVRDEAFVEPAVESVLQSTVPGPRTED
jgi:hypothetical protein